MPLAYDQVIKSFVDHQVEFVVIGATAAIAQGAPLATIDLDLCYRHAHKNVANLVQALRPFHPRLRGVQEDVPFIFDARTIMNGSNFTFTSDVGDLDILGYITGVGGYEQIAPTAVRLELFGQHVLAMSLENVIQSKKAAGRVKDKAQLPVLEETLRQIRKRARK